MSFTHIPKAQLNIPIRTVPLPRYTPDASSPLKLSVINRIPPGNGSVRNNVGTVDNNSSVPHS